MIAQPDIDMLPIHAALATPAVQYRVGEYFAPPVHSLVTQATSCAIGAIERRVKLTADYMIMLAPDMQDSVVPITTLEPELFDLIREIPVVVSPDEDGYLATFSDANIGMTGDTREEAVANLRLLLVDMFEDLEVQESRLGPHPQRQLATLRAFIHRRP